MATGNQQIAGSSMSAWAQKLARPVMFALGAALLAYLVNRFGSARVLLDLRSIGWRLVAIVALEALVSVASARVWWHTLPSQTRRGWFVRLFLIHLAGNALNQGTPGAPLGGEPVKVVFMKERFPISVTTASLLSTKLAQALARALFVIVGMLAAWWSLKVERLPVRALALGFILTSAGVAMFMALQIRGFSTTATRLSARLRFLGSWVERLERGLEQVDEHLRELYTLRPWDFVAAVALSVAGLCVGVVQVWLMMGWMGLQRDWLSSLTIEAFSVLVNFVLFAIPGSLGVQEGGKVLIFAALGLPVSAGLSMGVAFRLTSLITMAQGFAALLWLSPSGNKSRIPVVRPAAQESE